MTAHENAFRKSPLFSVAAKGVDFFKKFMSQVSSLKTSRADAVATVVDSGSILLPALSPEHAGDALKACITFANAINPDHAKMACDLLSGDILGLGGTAAKHLADACMSGHPVDALCGALEQTHNAFSALDVDLSSCLDPDAAAGALVPHIPVRRAREVFSHACRARRGSGEFDATWQFVTSNVDSCLAGDSHMPFDIQAIQEVRQKGNHICGSCTRCRGGCHGLLTSCHSISLSFSSLRLEAKPHKARAQRGHSRQRTMTRGTSRRGG